MCARTRSVDVDLTSAVLSRCSQSSMPRASSCLTYSMNSLTSPCICWIFRRMLRMTSTPARFTPRSRVSVRIVSSCSRSSSEYEPRVAVGPRRLQEPFALVEAQRLRVDVVLLRHRADHVVGLAASSFTDVYDFRR